MANVTEKQISKYPNDVTTNQSTAFTDQPGRSELDRKPSSHNTAKEEKKSSVTTSSKQWVGRAFADRASAERAYEMLLERGYENRDINLLMSKETRERYFPQAEDESAFHHKAKEGTAEKVTDGAMKGALIGTLLTLGANIVLPGVGLFLGGPLFIGLGALTGSLSAVLAESGIPQQQAIAYEEDVKAGRIVMGVKPQDEEDAEYLEREWEKL
jgi:hypothetical protein